MAKVTALPRYDEKGHDEKWRNDLAKDLNTLVSRVEYFRGTSNDESDKAAEKATLRVVQRVAEFEEIEEL